MQPWQVQLRRFEQFIVSGDFDQAFRAVDHALSEGVAENFARAVDHQGRSWPPRKDNLPHPLLVKTGRMLRAATTPGGSGHKFDRQGDSVRFGVYGSVVGYAIFHHMGTSRMPMRRVVYASAATKLRAFAAFKRGIERDFRQWVGGSG